MSNKPPITFEVLARDGEARAGMLTTRRGVIETPVFMPVGTAGTVKARASKILEDELDARIILGNTYHLWLRPGRRRDSKVRRTAPLHRLATRAADGFRRFSGLESGRAAKDRGRGN